MYRAMSPATNSRPRGPPRYVQLRNLPREDNMDPSQYPQLKLSTYTVRPAEATEQVDFYGVLTHEGSTIEGVGTWRELRAILTGMAG